jgi:hypothetical protein
MKPHLNDDQLIELLYTASTSSHVENCPECALRLSQFQARRVELTATPSIANDFLAAQRRTIYSRLGEPAPSRLRWAPAALAAACLLIVGMFVFHPIAPAPAVHTDGADAQLFSEVYSMEEFTEPIAAVPIHALFEDNQ